uniref:P/Homo B domain-containing protein n=1 Tax=Gadus morhua TaxID=8049 RepID=A0A8C5FU44_GADMO
MVCGAAVRRGSLFVLVLYLGFGSTPCTARVYTNHWALRIAGGPDAADRIAEKYGYRNMGQIGDLTDLYHFFHSRTIKRSTLSSRGHHSFISMEPKVEWIQQQVVKRRIKRDYKQCLMFLCLPSVSQHCNDDVHNCQSDMNIMGAWKRGYTGKDVVVTILDDGIEHNHPDLLHNYDPQASFDVNGNDMDPMPRYDASNENKHGTRCAGEVAAAANNSHCVVGIAYNARIGGVRMLDGDVTDMVEAKSLSHQPQHIDIYSASWGPDDDGKTVDGPASLARQAFENGIRMGRKGRGSIFVWASGNGGRSRDHCSCDGYTNSIYTISISSTAESGRKPWYLEECSSTLTTTYSSGENYDRKIITTDLRHRCTDSHTGTSASAPMAAAIIALALEANPVLTWRDVQHIIVKTSRAGHLNAPDWKTNAAGYNVSHLYGFGLMDAEAMVKEAERWKQVPAQHICVESADRQIRTIRSEHVVRSVYKATGCTDNPNHRVIYLEHVVVRITITHPRRGDLSINLTSPSGTKSQLLANRLFDHSSEGFKNWEFMTTHCWGEKAAGDWVLEIYDSLSQLRSQKVPGKLKEWSLVLYGTSVHPYSSPHSEKPRSIDPPEEFPEYNGPCHSECNENGCEGPGPHHCINCLHYFFKFKNNTRMCVSECPSGFFRDDRRRCKKCSSLCEMCVGSRSDQCTTCRPGFHLNEGSNTCVASCSDNSNICRRCAESCKRCSAANICTECKPGMSLQGNKCQMTCDPGTYYNGHRRACETCNQACASCAGTGVDGCTKCAEGYMMEEWRCVLTCSIGYYRAEQTTDGQHQRTCKRCDHSCYECAGPGERNCTTCVSGYTFEDGVCLVSTICKDGQYLSHSGKCHPCDVSCGRCGGPESNDCISCPDSRFFDDGRCECFCRRGHYAMDRQCDLCHHTCHECNEDSLFNCTSCEKDKFGMQRYLLRGECRASCPEGTFHASGGRCEPCAADCAVCAALEFCLRCRPGLSSRDGRCLPLLCADGERTWWHPLGEVADPKTDDCQPCEEGCKKCQHTTLCMSCEDEYYKWGSDCYRFCPERSFSVEDSMVCYPCEDQHCINCDQSQCYWCEEGFSILDGDCVDYCKNGFFMDATEHECEPCHVSCRACGGPQYNDCDQCEDGLTLTAGTCLEQQTWALSDQGVCEGCHPSCKTCTGLEKRDCHTCPPGRFLTGQQSCVFQCPSSWFANQTSGRCQSCLPGCEMCLDSLSCVQCHNGSAGLYLQDGQCVNNCDRCMGINKKKFSCPCSSPPCPPPLLLPYSSSYFHSPSPQPPPPPLLLHVLPLSLCGPPPSAPFRGFLLEQQCHPCSPECTSCMLNASHCLSCAAQYLLFDHTCLGHCPLGFYAQEECMHCHVNCMSCNGPESDDCTSCQNPKAVRYCGECLNQCPLSTYYDQHTEKCRDCAESCLTCSDHESSSCLSCKDNRRLDEMGHCVWYSQCSVHTYIDEKGQCLLCDPLCHRCSGPGKGRCLNCATLFLLNNTCIEECPAGYYGDREEMACKRCHESCVSCVGRHSVECVTCKPGQFYHGQSCVESCSEGNTTSGLCERCEPSCSRCSGPSSHHCLGCREDYWYHTQSGRCLKACPLGYYHDTLSKTCRKCHPSCNTCNGTCEGPLACESCYKGYDFLVGICESQCMLGFYATPQPNCQPCEPSCLDCRGPSQWNCTVCPSLQLLSDDGRCMSCCSKETHSDRREPIPYECCDCQASIVDCVPGFNVVPRGAEELAGSRAGLWVALCVLLTGAIGGTLFLLLQARSKAQPVFRALKAKAGGYQKLDGRRVGLARTAATSSLGQYSDHIVQSDGRDDEDGEEEEEENIVYMGQDGTMYRKFRYGPLDEDEEVELEYDDESYSFRSP